MIFPVSGRLQSLGFLCDDFEGGWAKQFDYDNNYYYSEQSLCFVVLGCNLVRSYEDCPFALEFQNFLDSSVGELSDYSQLQ